MISLAAATAGQLVPGQEWMAKAGIETHHIQRHPRESAYKS